MMAKQKELVGDIVKELETNTAAWECERTQLAFIFTNAVEQKKITVGISNVTCEVKGEVIDVYFTETEIKQLRTIGEIMTRDNP